MPFVVGLFALFLTNCSKDEEVGPAPTITFSPTSVQITQDTTIAIVVSIKAEEKIKEFIIKKKIHKSDGTIQTTNVNVGTTDYKGKTNFDYPFTHEVKITDFDGGVTKIIFEFTVTDEKDQTTSKTLEVTKKEVQQGTPFGAHKTYTNITMGAQSNASLGSFFATSNGQVYLISQAQQNQSLIDLVYYYGAINLATFAAPSDPTVNGGGSNFNFCSDWSVKNNTYFIKVNVNFDNLSNTTDISNISFSEATTKVTNLNVNDVVAFKTVNNKIGFIKIKQLQSGGTGTITFDCKVQE